MIAEFQGPSVAPKAMPGDLVFWDEKTETWTVSVRAKYPPIVGILELNSKTKYGMTSRGLPMYLFLPCHKQYPMMIVGSSHRDVSRNQLAVVNFSEWTTTGFPRGTLVRLLGPCGDHAAENEALFLTYNPFKACKPVIQDETVDVSGRLETPPLTFNIDPPGCKDIDDVLSLHVDTDNNVLELWITIADVAAHIQPKTELDTAAYKQGATAYLNGEAVRPMLPAAYSEDRCSLHPGTERLGVSLILSYKNMVYENPSMRWCLSVVKNRHQFDYDTFVDEGEKLGIPISPLKDMASAILGHETDDPHKWIEAFMLKYNLEAAKILRDRGHGILRKHEMADLKLLAKYQALGGGPLEILANRAALYCQATDDAPLHWGLKATVYCHATSPIRRYADLVNQRVLKAHILGQPLDRLVLDLHSLNARQKDLKAFERDAFLTNVLLESRKQTHALVLDVVIVDEFRRKFKLWIPHWNRVMSWKTSTVSDVSIQAGTWIQVSWFANPAKRYWKEGLVFRLEKILQLQSQEAVEDLFTLR